MAAKVLWARRRPATWLAKSSPIRSLYVNTEALARFGITLSDELAARAIEAE